MRKIAILLAAVISMASIGTVFAEDNTVDEREVYGYEYKDGELIPIYEESEMANPIGKVHVGIKSYLEEHKNDIINREKNLQESIDDLSKMKILQGYPDGDFHVDENVTRAQMAVFLFRISSGVNYSKHDKEYMKNFGAHNEYKDISDNHWAVTELSMLSCLTVDNVIEGYEDNTIRPDNNVTYKEAAAMILRTLDYFKLIEEKGGYPDGVQYWAEDLGLFNRTNALDNLDAPATRGDIIIMLSTALDSPVCSSLDENCVRVESYQKSPITMRQLRDYEQVDSFDILDIYVD